jgi:multidrug resistance efflux pump
LQASSLRNKDELIKSLDEGGIPPKIKQQMDQMQQHLQETQKQLQDAQQQLQQAGNDQAKNQADVQLKAAELEIKRYEAETARILALRPEPLTSIPNGWPADGQTPGATAHGSAAAA